LLGRECLRDPAASASACCSENRPAGASERDQGFERERHLRSDPSELHAPVEWRRIVL